MLEKYKNITIKMMDGLGPRGGGWFIYQKHSYDYTELSKETTNFACTWTIKPTLQGLIAINFNYYYKLRAYYHKNAVNQSIVWIFNDTLKDICLWNLLFTTNVKLHLSLVSIVYYQCQTVYYHRNKKSRPWSLALTVAFKQATSKPT